MVKAVLTCFTCLWFVSTASAQIVRGTVVDESNNAALHGVFIALLDSAGNLRTGTLSDSRGFFAIRAPYEGTFSLRAERIGHRSITTPSFSLSEQTAHTVDIRVAIAAIALAPIDVTGTKRCELRREQGRRTAQLWDEARKALTVADLVEKEEWIRFESRSWTRELDPYTLDIRNESVRYGISGNKPYRAVSVDSLARFGFVQFYGNDIVYFGPDAEVLLSDVFLEQHCFRTVVGSGLTGGLVGLAFEPVQTKQERDIEGTLWMDAKSLELRHIEYRYTNMPRTHNLKTLGGRTDFRRLPNGAWIVDRWYIRMPMAALNAIGNNVRLTAVQEEGGEVVSIRDARSSTRLVEDGSVTGAVYDSINNQPLTNALVYLSGTSYRATTDSAGRYTITDVPVGRYVVTFTHARLDSLLVFPQPMSVDVAKEDTAVVQLGIATVASQLREKCGVTSGGTLFGKVANADGVGQADAEVSVTFQKYSRAGASSRAGVEISGYTTTTDGAGRYVLCSLPGAQRLTVSVETLADQRTRVVTQVGEMQFKRLDIEVK